MQRDVRVYKNHRFYLWLLSIFLTHLLKKWVGTDQALHRCYTTWYSAVCMIFQV